VLIRITDGTTNKAYTATEKTKLSGVASGATANSTDAQLRDRSTHTGTQSAGTITGRFANSNLPLAAQLFDNAGTPQLSADLSTRRLFDTPGVDGLSLDYSARQLFGQDGTTVIADWGTGNFSSEFEIYAPGLRNPGTGTLVDVMQQMLTDEEGTIALHWLERKLIGEDGSTVAMNWSSASQIELLGVTFTQEALLSLSQLGDHFFDAGGEDYEFRSTDGATSFSNSGFVTSRRIVLGLSSVNGSASITFNAALSNRFVTSILNATAFAINSPSNPADGQNITVTIRNASAGALGAVTWNAVFKLATWTQPAAGFSRSITFNYDGTNWVEISRTPADVPN
jgi:hypothetical protein